MSLPTHSPRSRSALSVANDVLDTPLSSAPVLVEFDPSIRYGAAEIADMDAVTRQMLIQAALAGDADLDWDAMNAAQLAESGARKSVFATDDEDDDGTGYVEIEREQARLQAEAEAARKAELKAQRKAERQRKREARDNRAVGNLYGIATACILMAGGAGYFVFFNSNDAATPTPAEAFLEGATAAHNAVPSDSVTDVRIRPSEVASSASVDDADGDAVAENVIQFGGDDK